MNPASRDSQLETLLESLPPALSPRLDERLSSAPWTRRGIKRRQRFTVLYATLVLLAAFITLTPQGRAFAQTIFKFFTTTDQSSRPLSQEEIDLFYTPVPTFALSLVQVTPLSPAPSSCSTAEGLSAYSCEIQRIEADLNMDLKEFATTPPGWAFAKAGSYTDPSTGQPVVEISYRNAGAYLSLRQGGGDFSSGGVWDQVLSAVVEPVYVGPYYGEYVNGGFGVRNGETTSTWFSDPSEQRIRWREGEHWFEIAALVGPGTTGYLDKQALISLASKMVYQPQNTEQTAPVNLAFIPTISQAETICGCDILQPNILPETMTLDEVRYDPQWKSITLNYGYHALRIVQTPLESALIRNLDSYKNVETVQLGEGTGQYGISPAQTTIWDSAKSPVFPVTNSYAILLWIKDGRVYQIYFDQSYSGGAQLTKEQMIEIAESLR